MRWLLFKDSISGTGKPRRYRFPGDTCKWTCESKGQSSKKIMRGQWPKPLTKCRSRKSEAASPIGAATNATLRSLDLAGLRRGLASYTLSNKLVRVLWLVAYVVLFRFSPRPWHWWRSFLLRCFGARIDAECHIYGAARIWAPWNLICHSAACVADTAEIYNPVNVTLGEGAVISQGAFLCAASHDYADPAFPIVKAPITVGKRAWVAARAIVLMGVNVGEGSVIGAGSVVTRDVPPRTVCAGNPARVVKKITSEAARQTSEM